jgi:excinuclease ABC subunit B
MAEELDAYLRRMGVRCAYIHSDVDTLERIKILDDLRHAVYDVLVGVNLLREGLDLPEVSLVAIIDADKEGFLRSHRSLTQTAGRAARHLDGTVIMYADRITDSMQKTIDETTRRRAKQAAYNAEHGITPTAIHKKLGPSGLEGTAPLDSNHSDITATDLSKLSGTDLQKLIDKTKKAMQSAAKKMEFIEAAQLRDEMLKMEEMRKGR